MRDPKNIADAWLTLGKQLAMWRQAAGYTQDKFSPMVRYARSSIANIETGKQRADRGFWERADGLVHANGALLANYDQVEEQRRARFRSEARSPSPGQLQSIAPPPLDRLQATANARAVLMKEVHDSMPAHQPNRPSWLCRTCVLQWPCPARREELLSHAHDKPWLTMYMTLYLADAVKDLVIIPGDITPITRRFLGWLYSSADTDQNREIAGLMERLGVDPRDAFEEWT